VSSSEFRALTGYPRRVDADIVQRSIQFRAELSTRRSVRDFSPRGVPREVIEECLQAAASAPSGANLQPWHFAVVGSLEVKQSIREKAEAEEREFYRGRAPAEWLAALAPLGTDEHKPFLEIAPWLIVIFAQAYGVEPDGATRKHYYVNESVGIATGLLIAALHHAGLATLTHTPSPMGFLNEILDRPKSERPYLLLVVGHPSAAASVPALNKKSPPEFSSFH
jgi:iodotyrosine deiodinase